MRRRAPILLVPLAINACGPTPIEVAGPVPETPPQPLAIDPMPARPAQVLKVAGDAARPTSRRMVTVDAKSPRTSIGQFPAGTRVKIAVVETRWNNDPSAPFFDAAGSPGDRCGAPGHTCVGGNDAAPLMGLILLTTPASGPRVAHDTTCAPRHRLFIPNGVEFAVPEDTELSLAPNDREDGLADNRGSIRVQVETAQNKGARGAKVKVDVDARAAQTSLGRFTAGQYVRISVLGGRWSSDGKGPMVDAGGLGRALCQASGGHLCPAGDGKAPMMGLVLLVGPCVASAPRAASIPRYIPDGVSLVLDQDSELALGPNDWEDGCANNAGAAIVDVEAELP